MTSETAEVQTEERTPRNEQGEQDRESKTYADLYFEQELESLEETAQTLVDEFWERYWEIRKTHPKSEWGYLGVRLQRRDNGISIEWYRAQFRQGQKRPYMIHIPRGKGYAYTSGAFKRARAKDWELEKAMELEEQFAAIRRKLRMLAQMRRYYFEYRKDDLAGNNGTEG